MSVEFLQDVANLPDNYDFLMFGTTTPMPKGDVSSFKRIKQEVRKLRQQYDAYETYSRRRDLTERESQHIETIIRYIADQIIRLEQLHESGVDLRRYEGMGIRKGLSYKGKKHGFIRNISRMGKGLKMGGALDNANIAQYLKGWWDRLRTAGPAPAEAIESDGDFWEAFRYVLENPGEKAGYPKRLLALVFRLLDERGILFERVAGQLVPGPFFQNHEDMADLARDFFINNVMLKDNNA